MLAIFLGDGLGFGQGLFLFRFDEARRFSLGCCAKSKIQVTLDAHSGYIY
jgi:hypothetical protein